jgi:hypothetical protein
MKSLNIQIKKIKTEGQCIMQGDENMKERNHLGAIRIGGRIILK